MIRKGGNKGSENDKRSKARSANTNSAYPLCQNMRNTPSRPENNSEESAGAL